MRSRSFRTQIVLWSVLVSGAVLICFGLVAWWSLQHDRLGVLDESLTTFGFRHATRASPHAEMNKIELSMVENFGADGAATRFFAFLSEEGGEIHRSAAWPQSLNPADYPSATTLLDPQPTLPKLPPIRGGREEAERRSRQVYEPRFYTAGNAGNHYRLGVFANPEVRLVVGADLRELSGETDSLRRAFLVALPGALLLVGGGAWWLSRRALRSVHALGENMKHVSAQALESRLEAGNADVEFAAIIDQYNAMLERLERSFRQATRFSADASHELKTPLAVMRGTLERALAESGEHPASQAVYSDLLEQIDRQKGILEGLLLLSRADSGQLRLSPEVIDLSGRLNLWLEDAGYLAEERGLTIRSEVAPGLLVSGDPNLLQQVAHNLFSNAVRHNVEGGEVFCRLREEGESVVWEISNTGPLVEDAERERIFSRFERGRSAQGAGSGLGLSLVREILSAHGGTVSMTTADGQNCFRILLPKITSS